MLYDTKWGGKKRMTAWQRLFCMFNPLWTEFCPLSAILLHWFISHMWRSKSLHGKLRDLGSARLLQRVNSHRPPSLSPPPQALLSHPLLPRAKHDMVFFFPDVFGFIVSVQQWPAGTRPPCVCFTLAGCHQESCVYSDRGMLGKMSRRDFLQSSLYVSVTQFCFYFFILLDTWNVLHGGQELVLFCFFFCLFFCFFATEWFVIVWSMSFWGIFTWPYEHTNCFL